MAVLEENGTNLWRLGKVCDACCERGKPYKKDEIAESFFDQLINKDFLLIKEKLIMRNLLKNGNGFIRSVVIIIAAGVVWTYQIAQLIGG